MLVIDHRRELQRRADAERAAGRRLALVPTMGALHAGHLSLVDEARKRADAVWVSIFVNPTQFDEAEDFEGYPRELESDLAVCREAGVELVYLPQVEDLYPPNSQTWVEVGELTRPLCGASRPGHFRGVTTVVSKLLLAAKPHVAVFGEKDFQQLAVIRRMARDLGFDVEIVGAPTLRESDGLALSSRNVRLGPRARQQAVALVRSLDSAEAAATAGERSVAQLLEGVRRELATASQAEIDYAELRDADTLELIADTIAGPTLLALAVNFRSDPDGRGASVRLIDNRVLLRSETG
jgi:pantoate--beta-alanine ligase